jgi:hypothetical protein
MRRMQEREIFDTEYNEWEKLLRIITKNEYFKVVL